MNSENKPNRLINEKSPYLLQHAYNPVDWYPWGEEAFSKAKSEDKPIFLSIGYSTCHWCHVMEKESFEDKDVSNFLNRYFISIKVDREERPDIDNIYMNVCESLTGSGGWPLTIFMTFDKKPFFAGTYFPKRSILSILENVEKAWESRRESLINLSSQIFNTVNYLEDTQEELKSNLVEKAFYNLKSDFDNVYGGFGISPKFPSPHNLYFLLVYWYEKKDKSALYMVKKTLDSMYRGGIFDHIGYGFSRYSTDKRWLVPHFEKMLYDNALLSILYIETYAVTKDSKYSDAAKQIFAYILRDMTSEEGGFFSAEDADSEGKEGKFYIWTVNEVKNLLGEEDGDKFCRYFNITPEGNFEGKNIPNLINTIIEEKDLNFINKCRLKLFNYREKRIHPYKDDKILTSWNGLMIAAMAIGGRIVKDDIYISASEKAAKFILEKLIRKDGRLLAVYREGAAKIPAYLDDYAFFIWGLIELYETTFKPEYIEEAVKLSKDLIKYFWDDKNGGFFIYGNDSENLIIRPKKIYDEAYPSGNSVSALNFLRLSRLTGMYDFEDKANQILKTFGRKIQDYPEGCCSSLTSFLFSKSKGEEIIIVSDKNTESAKEMINAINEKFRPFTSIIFYSDECKGIEKTIPFISNYKSIEGKPTAYICKNFSCKAPITDIKYFY